MRHLFSEHPLVVASNRDEDLCRPSEEPRDWDDAPSIYAPRDLVFGGTWIGINRQGVFIAITNRDDVPHRTGCGSRGRLLSDALAKPSAREARESIEQAFKHISYNGFHIAIVDAREGFLLVGDGDTLHVNDLPAQGLTVLTGYGTAPGHSPRATEIERRVANLVERNGASPEALDTLLTFHADHQPEHAACVHDKNESHKTISSMIVRANTAWTAFETWDRTGFACQSPLTHHHVTPINRHENR
jgi:uncharacterized protein with NRDE domain